MDQGVRPTGKTVPIRMCVICRGRFPKNELTRFVVRDGERGKTLEPDETQTLSGRGYYLCPSAQCAERMARYKVRPKAAGGS